MADISMFVDEVWPIFEPADSPTAKYEIPEKRHEDDEKHTITTYEPLGVVVAICPWNCSSHL